MKFGTVFLFSKSAEATCDELLLEKLHNMKKSIILSWAFSIIALRWSIARARPGRIRPQRVRLLLRLLLRLVEGQRLCLLQRKALWGAARFYAIALRFWRMLPFGRLWYSEPDAVSDAIGHAQLRR